MTNITIQKNDNKIHSRIRWSLIILFIAFVLISQFLSYNIINQLFPIVVALSLFIVSWMHGSERYGYGRMAVFFIIVWIVFAIFISRYDNRNGINSQNKMFWYEAAVLYSFQGILSLLSSITCSTNVEIFHSLGLISVFTVLFVPILAIIIIGEIRIDDN